MAPRPIPRPAPESTAAALQRIEAKLDQLLAALAEDGGEPPNRTLDGELFPGERDATRPL